MRKTAAWNGAPWKIELDSGATITRSRSSSRGANAESGPNASRSTSLSPFVCGSDDRGPRGREVAVPSELVETQLDPAREQRRAPSERYRRDRHDHLVQQPDVRELAGQVSAADDPDVAGTGCSGHLLVHLRDVRA